MNKKLIVVVFFMIVLMFGLILGSNLKKDKRELQVVSENISTASGQNSIESKNNIENNSIDESVKNNNANESKVKNEESKQEKSDKSLKTDVNKKSPTGNTTYYIKVNYEANTVTIYEKDDDGYYAKPVKAMICSCGTATPTSGVYKTSQGYEWGFLEGGTFGRYSTRIKGGIMFHSVPYVEEREDTLEYWEYDKLGTTASLGCVRLCVKDCKWIFDNCEVGTQVEFYADSNPGPLGKPSAKKISDNEECRNWDPTDPSPNNPWNK